MRVVGLLLLASVVASFADQSTCTTPSCADDEVGLLQSTAGKPLALTEDEAESKTKSCMLFDPVAMKAIEDAATAAATKKKTASIAAAKKESLNAVARADVLKKTAITAATAEYTASKAAADSMKQSLISRAEAEVAANTTKVMTQINFKRQDDMSRVTRETKREMDDIQRNFEHENIIYKTDADRSVSQAKDAAHDLYMNTISAQLAKTRGAFATATAKHKTMRGAVILKYNTDKTLAEGAAKARGDELRRYASKKHLADIRLAKAMQKRKIEKATKIAAAAMAAAGAKKKKDLADAENDSKVAQMGSWVASMEAQFDRAADKYCEY